MQHTNQIYTNVRGAVQGLVHGRRVLLLGDGRPNVGRVIPAQQFPNTTHPRTQCRRHHHCVRGSTKQSEIRTARGTPDSGWNCRRGTCRWQAPPSHLQQVRTNQQPGRRSCSHSLVYKRARVLNKRSPISPIHGSCTPPLPEGNVLGTRTPVIIQHPVGGWAIDLQSRQRENIQQRGLRKLRRAIRGVHSYRKPRQSFLCQRGCRSHHIAGQHTSNSSTSKTSQVCIRRLALIADVVILRNKLRTDGSENTRGIVRRGERAQHLILGT